MDLVPGVAADMAFDGVGEVERPCERPFRASLLDHARDAAGVALLAEEAEDAGEVTRLETVDHVGGAGSGPRHAHIERPVGAKRKATLGLVELHGGDADVEHDAVDLAAG